MFKVKFSVGKKEFGFGIGSNTTLYEGANNGRERTTVASRPNDSKRDLSRWTRTQLLAKARHFYANDGLTRGAIRDLALYSIGPGLKPQAQTDNTEWNEAAEAYWNEWCKIADVTGKHNFNTLQRLISIAIDRDGDVGLLLIKTASGFPQIQLIESHRIGSESDGTGPAEDGTEWVDGVKIDRAGRVLAYKIMEGDSLGGVTYREVSARDFIFLYDAERCDQVRGVTSLYAAINTIHDKKDIVDFEKMGVKNASAFLAVLKAKSGEVDPADWDEPEETEDLTPEEIAANAAKRVSLARMQGGLIPVIGKDDEIQDFPRERPQSAFQGFLEFLIRDISVGLGLPYEFVWNPEKLGGTAQRFVLEKAQRRFAERQELFKNRLVSRLWFWVMSVGIQRGDLDFQEGAWRVLWQNPPELSVDAGRDANSDREDVKMGMQTESENASRRGMDWQDMRKQKEREVLDLLERASKIAAKYKIPIETAVTLLQQSTPNGLTFTLQAAGQPANKGAPAATGEQK